jgi:chemotaxis protein methyltransferase WspC
MKQVEDRLRLTIGLDAASIGSTLIERIVRLRMKSHGIKRIEEYERLLQSSRPEWDELVESVLVTETWFFRDREPFAAFVRLVAEEWLPAHKTDLLRVLSVPCASGEEPYSLVMALLEAGVPAQRFHVHAVDISARALARASRAIYGKNSFRDKDLSFRGRYFQATKEGFTLSPDIRSLVSFQQGNLLSPDFMAGRENYDFIFCRNLLIYFDRPTRSVALEKVDRLLAPGGVLFVGPAEQPLVIDYGFVSANIPMASACRKASPASGRSDLPRGVPAKLREWPLFSPELQPHNRSRSHALSKVNKELAPELKADGLNLARGMADAGFFKEAAELCRAHLRANGASAQAYYLLGLVGEAVGDPGAIDCYRKALYLAPDHYETLLQMASLFQKNGDTARARTFRTRAQRNKPKTPAHP